METKNCKNCKKDFEPAISTQSEQNNTAAAAKPNIIFMDTNVQGLNLTEMT